MANNENQCSNSNSNSSSHHRIQVPQTPDKDEVVNRIQVFLDWYQGKYESDPAFSSTPSTKYRNCKKVKDMARSEVLQEIDNYKRRIKKDGLKLVDQSPSNIKFEGEMKGAKRILIPDASRCYKPKEDTEKVFHRVLDLLHKTCIDEQYITLRHLYYRDVDLFGNQSRSNKAIDQVSCEIGCTRSSLNVFASDRGSVIGPFSFMVEKFKVNCNFEAENNMKCKFGQHIPPFLNLVSDLENNGAKFILLVEKYSIYIDLAQNNFHNDYNCIIITGMGMPDASTRQFTKILMDTFKLPAFSLTDSDPWGFEISTVYSHGSEKMAYDSKNLACPLLYWLGVWPSDLTLFGIRFQELTDADEHKIEQLLEKEFVIDNEMWTYELNCMRLIRGKAELESLSGIRTHYLSKDYLPYKLHRMMGQIMEGKYGN